MLADDPPHILLNIAEMIWLSLWLSHIMKLKTCLKRVKSSALLNSKAKKYTHDLTQMRPKRLLNWSIMKSVNAFFNNHLSYVNAWSRSETAYVKKVELYRLYWTLFSSWFWVNWITFRIYYFMARQATDELS